MSHTKIQYKFYYWRSLVIEKKEYLIRTFSRTKKKDYENYILNSVYQRLNRLDIKPVTQQYVKHQNGSYYLMDLYFPQLNISIECDEAHHIHNKELDWERTLNIEKKLSAIKLEDQMIPFKELRIDATTDIYTLHERMDEVATEIVEKAEQLNIQDWDPKKDLYVNPRKFKKISITDDYRFRLMPEVLNIIFFENYSLKYNYKVGYTYEIDGENVLVWFPTISDDGTAKKGGWLNTINDNWDVIKEEYVGTEKMSYDTVLGEKRIIFAKIWDQFGKYSYRYIGNFQLIKKENGIKTRFYKRISDHLEIDVENKCVHLPS